MDGGQFQLLGIVGLVIAAGALAATIAVSASNFGARAPGVAWLRKHAPGVAGRICLAALGLAGLLAVFATRSLLSGADTRVVYSPWMWAQIGVGRPLPMGLQFDALAGICACIVLAATLVLQVSALVRGRSAGTHARLTLACGGALLICLARSLWVAALGWHLIGGVAIACAYICEQGRANQLAAAWAEHRRQRLTDLALWLGIACVGSIAVGFDPLSVTALMQGRSALVTRELAGVSLAGAATGLFVLATARQILRAVPGGRVHGTYIWWLGGLGALVMLCRIHAVLALSPTVLVAAVAGGLVAAGWGAVVSHKHPARGDHAFHLGLLMICLGVGAWVEAVVLHIVVGLLRLARQHAVGRVLVVVGLLAWSLLLGRVWASGWTRMTALTPGLNWAVAGGLVLFVLLKKNADTTKSREQEPGSVGAVLLAGALAVALVMCAVPGEIAWLEGLLGRVGGEAATFRGEYAIGWLPAYYNAWAGGPTPEVGTLRLVAAAGLMLACLVGGRLHTKLPLPALAAAIVSATDALAQRLSQLVAAPFIAVAMAASFVEQQLADQWRRLLPGRGLKLQSWLLLGLVTLGVVLSSVYMHPRAVVVGPTRVHPVDLGGLHPDIASARRGGGTKQSVQTPDDRDRKAAAAVVRQHEEDRP